MTMGVFGFPNMFRYQSKDIMEIHHNQCHCIIQLYICPSRTYSIPTLKHMETIYHPTQKGTSFPFVKPASGVACMKKALFGVSCTCGHGSNRGCWCLFFNPTVYNDQTSTVGRETTGFKNIPMQGKTTGI